MKSLSSRFDPLVSGDGGQDEHTIMDSNSLANSIIGKSHSDYNLITMRGGVMVTWQSHTL